MNKELSELQKLDCKTAPYQGAIYRKMRRISKSHTRVFGETGEGCEGQEYAYHVMSRTTGGDFLFGDEEKEGLKRLIWKMAQFFGVKVLTYCVMDNHFHILLRVRDKKRFCRKFHGEDGEANLLKHMKSMYSKAFLSKLRLEIEGLRALGLEKDVEALLNQFRGRFCDLSTYMKEVKERFSRWYNKKNSRIGTLWQGRFSSVLVEDGDALRAMSAYIDLNPVRAGIVNDPKDYRWSGYAEAIAGSSRAGRGLCDVMDVITDAFTQNQGMYRCWLFGDGIEVIENQEVKDSGKIRRRGARKEVVDKVIKLDGKLSRYELLRSKVKYFSDGVVIGSQSFISAQRRSMLEKAGVTADDIESQLTRGRRKDDLSENTLVTWRW